MIKWIPIKDSDGNNCSYGVYLNYNQDWVWQFCDHKQICREGGAACTYKEAEEAAIAFAEQY